VATLYLAFNIAIFTTLDFASVAGSKRIAFDLMSAALGPKGAAVAAVTVFTSGVAVLNAQCLGYPRILFALASDGLVARRIAAVHPITRAPVAAITICSVCAAIYVFSGSYAEILGYSSFVSQLFTTLMVLSLVILRYREPHLRRPYRVWGYPWTPGLFIAVSVAYLVGLAVTRTTSALVGILIVAAGVPVYFYFRGRNSAASAPDGSR
jgi:APA family basic amino acid/polyamine antiporter